MKSSTVRKQGTVFLIVFLCLQGFLVPKEGRSAAAGKPPHGGTLRIGLQSDLTNINPFIEQLSTNASVRGLVYEGLVDLDDKWQVHPTLAESWTISKDGKEYTFQLRKGVVFHNGKELDAEDVKWSLEYAIEPKNRAYVQGSVSVIDKIEVMGKNTIKLTTKQPFAPFLAISVSRDTVIVPKNSVPPPGETIITPIPGTGPFQLVEWDRANQIRQIANKRYWNKGIPYFDAILFRPIPSEDVRLLALRAGDLDLVEEIPYLMVNEIQKGKHPDIWLAPASLGSFRMMKMNVEAPHFNNPKVRKAVAHAIDRKAYINGFVFGHAQPAYQVTPKGHKWYLDEVKNIELDLEKARALLAEAGYPNGFKTVMEARHGTEAELPLLQSQLKKIGIDVEIKFMDFAQHRKLTLDGQYNIQVSGSDVYPDIDRALHTNYHSETGARRSRNHTGYKNAEVDRLLDRARAVMDPKERRELYKKATEIINEESPQVNIAFIVEYFGLRSYVKGFKADENGDLSFFGGGIPFTWIDKE